MSKQISTRGYYFSEGPYLQILQGLNAALTTPEAFIKLLGNARTGKSSLCEKLTLFLRRKEYQVVYFDYAIESPDMLRTMLARELDLPDSSNFARLLEDRLDVDSEKPVILIFDDAHLLTNITLLEIYRLAEVQVGARRMLNIVLCGEPSLEQRLLTKQEFKSLLLQVSHKFQLDTMNAETLSMFLASYVKKAGLPGLLLEPAAMTYLYKSCKGFPGPAAAICSLLVQSKLNDSSLAPVTKIELEQLIQASTAAQSLPASHNQDSNQRLLIAPLAAVLVIASIGFLYQQLNDSASVDSGGDLLAVAEIDAADNSTQIASAQSPFAEESAAATEVAVVESPDSLSQAALASTADLQVDAADSTATPNIEEPVSDSSLVLVTAAERGVSSADIAEPIFEELDAASTANTERAANTELEADTETPVALVEVAQVQTEAEVEIEAVQSTDTEIPAVEIAVTEPEPAAPRVLTLASTDVDDPVIAANASNGTLSTNFDFLASDVLRQATEPALAEVDANTEADEIEEAEAVVEVAVEEVQVEEAPQTVAVSQELSDAQAEEVAMAWVSAWQAQDLDSYFASYHSAFESRYHNDDSAWRSNRRRVIGNAAWIKLEMTEFKVIEPEADAVDPDKVEVQFWLAYQSPTYRDDTLKKLILNRTEDGWLILEEINLDVRT